MLMATELYYFSPTGGTKKTGMIFCEGFAEQTREINLAESKGKAIAPASDVVVIAAPVFGGRIPSVVPEWLHSIDGNGKSAVTLVVYGNRAYEDALLELNQVVSGQGFRVIASAALVAQHSMVPEVGVGRPDDQDREEILEFAGKVSEKISKGLTAATEVPGNDPYKDGMNMPVTPMTLPSCTICGKCEAVCPTRAISRDGKKIVTDVEKCILCMACTAVCPQQARILPLPLSEQLGQKMEALITVRGENEFFL
ncbi:MAG: EFR1 family ferrodoxin [Clostridiales bacterium]|nr:EFR1 family ferrodoxin [Clostridiales bacterium]